MVGYGHLGDVLGPPRTGGLGDLPAAADALRKAVAIAVWLRGADPADRTARFDLASARFRLGAVLLAQDGRNGEALSELEQARDLLADLQADDPSNVRYRYNHLYVVRKVGEALAALGRGSEAARCFTEVRAMAAGFKGTHSENEVQNGVIAADAELAKLKARSGDWSALALADEVAAFLGRATPGPGTAWGRAIIYADMAGVYRRMGRDAQSAVCLQKSAQMWREMKLPAALDGRRAKELAAVEEQAGILGRSAQASVIRTDTPIR